MELSNKPATLFTVEAAALEKVLPYRDLYRQDMNCQIVHDSIFTRKAVDVFVILDGDKIAGYGVLGSSAYGFFTGTSDKVRDTVYEFYLLPEFRRLATAAFRKFLSVSKAKKV